ncbi:S8 family serine peptidase [Solirubrobacter sp. CPCC 204708]|uniref:S8 family serine peptidase n=1 Tax=Solirubrobacter deserti TaxID=2282478 RepID=A0ABT4RFC3_9ACTN|nr:S8 family serine peptidase [Solirubrobacter deserti]MBE2319505.1 S8 family serine peptidase [Solirubrobacter deserti]MDA0137208.1 S8 family serine peptidase [Solirubrobacter deserti]
MSIPSSSRARRSAVAALLAVAVPLTAATSASAAPNAAQKLASAAKQHPNKRVTAIVQFKSSVSEGKAKAIVKAHKGKVTDKLPAVNGFAVKLPAKQAGVLKTVKGVANVTLNTKVNTTGVSAEQLVTNFPKTTGADQAWAQGITGKGIGVAVIDSGVNGDIADFKNADGSSRITNVISNPGALTAGDPVGHGTHVAGIVAGNSAYRTDGLAGKYAGIAPEADIVAIKTSDELGNSTVLDVINALQFVVERKDELNIRVVNLSVSSDTPGSSQVDPLNAAVEFAWHAGIVVVSAVGNRGNAADAAQYAPGNDPYVISVGATDEADTPNPADDTVAAFSSRGRSQDGFDKPDVFAPGAKIVAPLAAGSAFSLLAPATSIFEGGQYVRIGGTSMAAPVVAGAAALVLQARPELNPDQVKALLTQNVSPTAAGVGSVNVPAALAAQPGAANAGLTPNPIVKQALVVNGIDPTRATWTRATWTRATWTRATWTGSVWTRATWTAGAAPTNAPWARATWTCTACIGSPDAVVDPTRSTWSRSTWSRSTWSRSTWSRSTWSSIEW